MPAERCDFSREQWNFLAVFEAMGGPVSLDIVGAVSPLLPSQLFDVLKRAKDHALLENVGNEMYCLSKKLPVDVQESFSRINTARRISDLLTRLNRLNLVDHLSLDIHSNLLVRSGREPGGQFEINLAQKFLEQHQHEKALMFYEKGLKGLTSRLEQTKSASLFLDCALTFSDLTFSMGREFVTAYRFLETAGPVADRLGDRRAKTLIDLHVGRLHYIGNRRHDALALMKNAEAVIRDLGDDDIQIRAAEFLALYYYMQGRFSEAMAYFETGFRSFETRKGSHVANPSAPIFYGYCAAYLGQFHKAIGNLDSAWRRAKQEKNSAYAATLRASLGMILLLTKKEKEASAHIESACKEAKNHCNILGWYFAQGYMAYLNYLEGRYKTACRMLKEIAEKAKQANIVYQMSSPWLLEMLFDLRREGYSIFTENEFRENTIRMVKDPSIHIRGVVLRLFAQLSGVTKEDREQIKACVDLLKTDESIPDFSSRSMENVKTIFLQQSELCLKPTGDPVQLAKTRIALAQLALKSGNRKEAVNLAGKARKGLSGFWEDYFPDGIRALLDEHSTEEIRGDTPVIDNDQLLQAAGALAPSLDMNDFFHRMVATMNRLLRAEKGGLFWTDDRSVKSLSLRTVRNLSVSDITNPDFSNNMDVVRRCFRAGKPLIIRSKHSNRKLKRYNVFSLVCIPLKQKETISGVLYYDNSYLDDSFDFLDESVLEKLADLLNVYIDRVQKVETSIADAKASPLEMAVHETAPRRHRLLAASRTMATILENADQIAASDSTVLIQGETGVGKELMAERLHRLSQRRRKPFIIIDPTTIPENLVESELFGYEKGAFTGADKQKRGRIELAHQGTLFIDEIGEMPKSIQAKLLRVLQEKTFLRIGGSQPIHSDFRLVAATNRNLAREVTRGNFREDLFYRISIVPIHVPPLRERREDIVFLARHFVSRYAKKYNHPELDLSREDEEALVNYHWPGNVRELINVIERAVILSKGDRLDLSLKPSSAVSVSHPFSDTPTMDVLQRRYIEYILKKTNGRISGKGGAAEILNMKRSTLYSRMDKLGIPR